MINLISVLASTKQLQNTSWIFSYQQINLYTRQNVNYASGISHAIIKMNSGFRIFVVIVSPPRGQSAFCVVMNELAVKNWCNTAGICTKFTWNQETQGHRTAMQCYALFVPREESFAWEISESGTMGLLLCWRRIGPVYKQTSHVPNSRKHEKTSWKLFIYAILLEPVIIYLNHVRVILSE